MSTTDSRAAFESWAKKTGVQLTKDIGGIDYHYPQAKASWSAWQAATEAAKATGPAGEQWNVVPQTWIDLYVTGSYLAAQLGAIGELDARSPESLKFLSALVEIDGGTVSQRAVDLHEKAHMPLLQAHALALRECGTPSMQTEQAPDSDIFDLIREWEALPEGKRHDAARAIIGSVNRSYSDGVTDGKAIGEAARQPVSAADAVQAFGAAAQPVGQITGISEHDGEATIGLYDFVVSVGDLVYVTPCAALAATAAPVTMPEDIATDDALWRAGCKAFRLALNEMTGCDGYVVRKTYEALRAHILGSQP